MSPSPPLDPKELSHCLDEAKEIYRSLWDHRFLLVDLDIEYVNFDFPARPYLQFEEAFEQQRPLVDAIVGLLADFGIEPLHMLSGRGHHFVWQIKKESPAFAQLVLLGKVSTSLQTKYDQSELLSRCVIDPELAKAFAGLGLVLEYIAYEALRLASPASRAPVTLTAVETFSERGMRESVSFDLSEYGDPLHLRAVRVPFSVYYKPMQEAHLLGSDIVKSIPPLIVVPVQAMNESMALRIARSIEAAKELALHANTQIPVQQAGTLRLIEGYCRSHLAQIHGWYYEQEQENPENWPNTYDVTALDILPCSAQRILQEPNDLLLKPGCLRHIVRLFLSLGWHPRHIAGLVRSKLERDYGWGYQWYTYDAANRADFYCRIFTGLIVSGLDNLSDFSCPPVNALSDLTAQGIENFESFKQSLRKRLEYDRLASRPFHGLFL